MFIKDLPYLWKHVEAICRERDEATAFDNAQPTGKKDFFKETTTNFSSK